MSLRAKVSTLAVQNTASPVLSLVNFNIHPISLPHYKQQLLLNSVGMLLFLIFIASVFLYAEPN
jgi:hypothetical protein